MGSALARALDRAGVRVAAVASRNDARARALGGMLSGASVVTLREAGAAAPVVVLAVSDGAIESVASEIQPRAGTLVAHVSGFRDVTALAAARDRGARVGGFHPLAAVARGQSVAEVSDDDCAAVFRGGAFAIEGEEGVQATLAELARALGGEPFAIAASDKPLYHLGASMLAAFAAGLAQVSWDQLRAAGASPALASRGVGHLLETVAQNIARAPTPAAALTGPVARGDADGVRRQAHTARGLSPEARELYRVHALHNVHLARAAGKIDAAAAARLIDALREDEKTRRREDEKTSSW